MCNFLHFPHEKIAETGTGWKIFNSYNKIFVPKQEKKEETLFDKFGG